MYLIPVQLTTNKWKNKWKHIVITDHLFFYSAGQRCYKLHRYRNTPWNSSL